jgi:polysaccharide lyase-like protein
MPAESGARGCGAATELPRWVVAAVLAVATLSAARADTPSAAQFVCGFERSWSRCGFTVQAKEADRVSLVELAGMPGVRLRTLPGDDAVAGSGTAERTDLALSPEATGCAEGAEQWWTHAVLFPDDYALPVATPTIRWPWGVVFDFHHTGSQGQANFEVEVAGDPPELRFAISAGAAVSDGAPGSPTRRWRIGPIVKNHWYDFVYHVKWSSAGDGWFDAWLDGEQLLDYRGPTLYAGQRCYLKLANYHTPLGEPVSVVHARVVRAATRGAMHR